MERDERRLADLGRRAVEMYAVSQVFADLQVTCMSFLHKRPKGAAQRTTMQLLPQAMQ